MEQDHLDEETLFHYSIDVKEGIEDTEVKAHLDACEQCRNAYLEINKLNSAINQINPSGTSPNGEAPITRPTNIPNYEFIELIGEGGMGTIWKAKDILLNRLVAVKIIKPNYLENKMFNLRFKREAQILSKINHNNIVQIYNAIEHEGQLMIAMEYIQGQNLKDFIQNIKPDFFIIINLFQQILSGIQAAHQEGILHRDIKCSNVMINDKGLVKVLDFGLAKSLSSDSALTSEDLIVGTVGYMAPEIIQGDKASIQSDIYSLGIVFYEMIKPRVNKSDSSFYEFMNRIRTEVKNPIPYMPTPLKHLLIKMCENNNENRYIEVNHIQTDIRKILEQKKLLQEQPKLEPEVIQQTYDKPQGTQTPKVEEIENTAISNKLKIDSTPQQKEKLINQRYTILSKAFYTMDFVSYECFDESIKKHATFIKIVSGNDIKHKLKSTDKRLINQLDSNPSKELLPTIRATQVRSVNWDTNEFSFGDVCLVLEKIKGKSLAQYTSNRPKSSLSLQSIKSILINIIPAIQFIVNKRKWVKSFKLDAFWINDQDQILLSPLIFLQNIKDDHDELQFATLSEYTLIEDLPDSLLGMHILSFIIYEICNQKEKNPFSKRGEYETIEQIHFGANQLLKTTFNRKMIEGIQSLRDFIIKLIESDIVNINHYLNQEQINLLERSGYANERIKTLVYNIKRKEDPNFNFKLDQNPSFLKDETILAAISNEKNKEGRQKQGVKLNWLVNGITILMLLSSSCYWFFGNSSEIKEHTTKAKHFPNPITYRAAYSTNFSNSMPSSTLEYIPSHCSQVKVYVQWYGAPQGSKATFNIIANGARHVYSTPLKIPDQDGAYTYVYFYIPKEYDVKNITTRVSLNGRLVLRKSIDVKFGFFQSFWGFLTIAFLLLIVYNYVIKWIDKKFS